MKRHILLSTNDPGVGGVAQYNYSILRALTRLDYKVTCIQPQASSNFTNKNTRLDNVQYVSIENDNNLEKYLRHFFAESYEKPELIICSNTNPFSNFLIKQIAIQSGIPYIIVEGLVEPHLAEHFAASLDELSYHYEQAKSVIAVSYDNLDLLHNLFKLPINQGQVIYYGRPLEYFTSCDLSVRERLRQSLGIPLDAVVCFTTARIEARKGYHYQLEAIKQLIKSPVWPQLYFVWAGGGIFDIQLENQLKEAVYELEITNKVSFLGQVVDDVSNWLNIADIFVFPSNLEGMPLCVMEAMAKGLPVIATAVSGIPEELGSTGKLLPDPNIDSQATVRELVAVIQEWVLNPSLRREIGQEGKLRAEKMFREERMIDETVKVIERALLPQGDYVSPGFSIIQPDSCFSNMIVGRTNGCAWPYLRREIPHNWYVDKRHPIVGFVSRDEAHIIYNTALKFKGKKALEIGCWLGWSACHIALAGVELDVIDPILARQEFSESVTNSLRMAGVLEAVNLIAGSSPQEVEELATKLQRKWSLIFIDGNHEAPGPLNDAIICEQLAEEDALILFHDLASPDVAQGLDYFKEKGWNTMVYQTMQIMGVAWRGNIEPAIHQPDPKIDWKLPTHLQHYSVSGSLQSVPTEEFGEILNTVRQYTLLSEARLFSLYSLAKQVCLEDIPGNFVECGTCKGGAAALLAVVIQRYSLRPRILYAFDTFEGMPDPTEIDRSNGILANQTGFGAGTLEAPISENLDKICQILNVRDIVIPVKGLFAQTLPQYKSVIGNIAFLHADGDWYESTMDTFNTLYDIVVSNGIIQIDDYGHWEGCRKAVHDFEQLRGESFDLHPIDYTGVWFKKKNQDSSGQRQTIAPLIIVDGVFFQLYRTGIARVWNSLLEEWAKDDFSQHIIILDRAGTAPKIAGIRYLTIPAYNYDTTDADREMLQQVCDETGADLFISTYYTTPRSTPSVFMTYDMIPEVLGANFDEPMWMEKHHAIRHASAYISISENTACDLVKFFPQIPSNLVTVAHCGVANNFSPASLEEVNCFKTKYGISKPYFILVGAGSNYKNAPLFFQAFAKLYSKQGFEIICTGMGILLNAELRACTSGSTVHTLQLSDEELRVAYSGAVALVYPSKYEGFGMPVLEAMSCGCPVITCPNASIPEVAGEAALYVNDEDVEGLADALCEVQKPKVRNSLIAAGLEQAKNFSWSKMAKTVSTALIEATLIRLNLKEINLIIFPDWSQSEESLGLELGRVVRAIATHPDKTKMTLLVETSNISEEDANLALSSVAMNLLMEEDLDVSDGPEISLIGQLSEMQWSALVPRLYCRIVLNNENQEAIAQAKGDNISSFELDSFIQESN
jgi:glycosyltransferase involved in cell wall biosynthesis/predicted O-methyltransferase YrrM